MIFKVLVISTAPILSSSDPAKFWVIFSTILAFFARKFVLKFVFFRRSRDVSTKPNTFSIPVYRDTFFFNKSFRSIGFWTRISFTTHPISFDTISIFRLTFARIFLLFSFAFMIAKTSFDTDLFRTFIRFTFLRWSI